MSGFSCPVFQWWYQGSLAGGGSVNVYQSGTTTPITIYSDGALTTPISNPLTLDANGECKFYISGAVNIRMDGYTGPVVGGLVTGAFIETIDPIYPVSGASSSSAGMVVYQSTNLTISASNLQNNIIATAPINLALPLSSTLNSSFTFQFNAQGGAITFLCTTPDAINKGTAGTSFVVPIGSTGEMWTDASGNWGINFLSNSISPLIPQGRLTLTTGIPILTADVTAAGIIYYTPYVGQYAPIWNGTAFINANLGGQLTLTLNSTNHPTTTVFDVYLSLQSGIATLSAMAWSNASTTARSSTLGGKTATGNATITQKNGIWVNNATISSSDSFNSTTGVVIPQNQGTYLGSFYTTAAGQTGIALKPSPAAGGSNNIIGLWNAYNRIKATALERDVSSWTYASNAWRAANGSNSNRISWIDGLQQTNLRASYEIQCSVISSNNIQIGINLNSTSAAPNIFGNTTNSNGTNIMLPISENFYPQLGFNFIQAMEISQNAVTITFQGNSASSYALMLDLEV